jgi:F0F1-type ATP synthase assembly protein I|tara:strand:+ start:3513 stop:3728 length:216 start_codon:yes stop_codon:yes gene_type:complete
MVGKPKKEKKQLNTYARFSSISIQMMVIILGGTYLGVYTDTFFELSNKFFTILFSLTSVFAAIFFAYKKVS